MSNDRKIMYDVYVNIWIGKLWRLGDSSVGDILHENFTDNRAVPQFPNTKEGHIAMALDWNLHFPNTTFLIKEVIIEKDKLVGRYEAKVIHSTTFLGIPANNKEVILTGIDIMQFDNNKIIKWDHNEDMLGFMEQIKS